jgi:hypothetical protein
MQDEQYKKRAGKLTFVHSVKLLRNAGDLPCVQTGHRREQSVKNKKGKEIRVKKALNTRRSYNIDDTQGFGKVITFLFFLNVF